MVLLLLLMVLLFHYLYADHIYFHFCVYYILNVVLFGRFNLCCNVNVIGLVVLYSLFKMLANHWTLLLNETLWSIQIKPAYLVELLFIIELSSFKWNDQREMIWFESIRLNCFHVNMNSMLDIQPPFNSPFRKLLCNQINS